jgi:hypothetical protein
MPANKPVATNSSEKRVTIMAGFMAANTLEYVQAASWNFAEEVSAGEEMANQRNHSGPAIRSACAG